MKLAREATSAMRDHLAISGGVWPAAVQPISFFWARQMMPQTFISMTQPSPPPIPILRTRLVSQPLELTVRKSQAAPTISRVKTTARAGMLLFSLLIMKIPTIRTATTVQIPKKLPIRVPALAASPAASAALRLAPTIIIQYQTPANTVTTDDQRNHQSALGMRFGTTLGFREASNSFMNGMFTRLKK